MKTREVGAQVSIALGLEPGEVTITAASRRYCVRAVQMTEHLSALDLHRYSCVIDGIATEVVVNCGRNPPVLCVGQEVLEIDHEIQTEAIELFARVEAAVGMSSLAVGSTR